MDALVMCGGRGTRLDRPGEKPLLTIDGEAMVDRVLDALAASGVETIHAVVSPNAPDTREHVAERVSTIETPGEGYVADLDRALSRVDRPVLTVAADLPLLSAAAVDTVLAAHDGGSLTVCVPVTLKRKLGVSVDTRFFRGGEPLAPTGCNVVDEGDSRIHVADEPRLAVNVNRARDARVAARFVSSQPNHSSPRPPWDGL